MRNDIERAVDTVLSGLTVDAAQQQEIVRNAIRSASPSQKPAKSRDLKMKMKLSLTFPLPHLVVAALVVVIVTLAPLFRLPQQDPYVRFSSEDGQDYFVTNSNNPTPQPGAIAAPGNYIEATYRGTSFEEAEKAYQSHLPRITWLPEGATLELIDLGTLPEVRSAVIRYSNPYIQIHIFDSVTGEIGMHWVPQDQEGEHMTLSNGQKVYVTTNNGMYSICWEKGYVVYGLYTAASLEDALRMVESIK